MHAAPAVMGAWGTWIAVISKWTRRHHRSASAPCRYRCSQSCLATHRRLPWPATPRPQMHRGVAMASTPWPPPAPQRAGVAGRWHGRGSETKSPTWCLSLKGISDAYLFHAHAYEVHVCQILIGVGSGPLQLEWARARGLVPITVPSWFWHLLKHDALVQAWVFDPIVTIVVWSDFLRNKTDRKLTVMSQTYPDPIKKPLSQQMQISCKNVNFVATPSIAM